MTKAIGIATKALNRGSLRAAITVLLSSIILAACGGGAETVANPLP